VDHSSSSPTKLGSVGVGERARIGLTDRMRLTDEQADDVRPPTVDTVLDRTDGRGDARV